MGRCNLFDRESLIFVELGASEFSSFRTKKDGDSREMVHGHPCTVQSVLSALHASSVCLECVCACHVL